MSGELTLGPYDLLNTVAHWPGPAAIGTPTPVLVLRANMHLSEGGPSQMDLSKESVADYYGGDLDDELAALLALALGRRMRSGGITRRGYGDDERGTPSESDHVVPPLTPPLHRPILPTVAEGIELANAEELMRG